ncbi:altronate oxidoreductase [compost metagenome]
MPAGYDVGRYANALLCRLRNAAIAHHTAQIAMDGTQKVPVRWLPALRESLAADIERPCLERALAMWLHYLRCDTNEHGEPIAASDPGARPLAAALRGADSDTDAVRRALAHGAVFGDVPWPKPFRRRLAAHLTVLRERGAAALLSFPATT